MRYIGLFGFILILLSCRSGEDKNTKQNVEATDWKNAVIETDFYYNIDDKVKGAQKRITRIYGDSLVLSKVGNREYQYKIGYVMNQSDHSLMLRVKGNLVGGFEPLKPIGYYIKIEDDGYIQMERIDNGKKRWYISNKKKQEFENELSGLGFRFHLPQ